MTVSCRDTDVISKVSNAGKVVLDNGLRTQVMHNGLKVLADGYCGEWMTRIIEGLDGHHEPQEELLFFELLKHVRPDSTIVELGSYWAYYSCWYLKGVPGSRAICIEPNPQHLEIGKKNADINGLLDRIEFKNAWVGHKHDGGRTSGEGAIDLDCLLMDDVLTMADGGIELLHVDIQGAELDFLRTMTAAKQKVRFLVLSTHHKSISGSSSTHRDCIQSILDLGGFIMDEHDIDDSFSGDGLIVAGFHPNDRKINLPPISRNLPDNCLFPPEPFISYAQNFEDVMLWRALKHVKNGCYVDVGANDPVVDSVSKAFYDRGWRGIHVEPVFEFAERLRNDRPDEVVLQVAMGAKEGVVEFNVVGGLSTAVATYTQDYIGRGIPVQPVQVSVLTLKSALTSLVGKDVHWLKIDVEGYEKQVLQGWDDKVLRPWVIVVEATIPGSSQTNFLGWDPILIGANYQFVYFDGLNRFYVAKEHSELFSAFECPPNVFDGARLSGMAWSDWCKEVDARHQLAAESSRVRESSVQAQVAAVTAREKVLANLLAQAVLRENQMREQHDILIRIHRILEDRAAKGPLRMRQLLRHPKVFVRELLGLRPVSKLHRAPQLRNGFADEAGDLRLSLRWMLRQPKKAAYLIWKQPRKTLRFALRQPRKFLAAPKRHQPTPDLLVESDSQLKEECINLIRSVPVSFEALFAVDGNQEWEDSVKAFEKEYLFLKPTIQSIANGQKDIIPPEIEEKIHGLPNDLRHLHQKNGF